MHTFFLLIQAVVVATVTAATAAYTGLSVGDMFTVILALQAVQLSLLFHHRGRIASQRTAIEQLKENH